MTAIEQALQQIELLSPDEKAALRKHLEESNPAVPQQTSDIANEHGLATGQSKTQLWGLFADDAEELDSIVESAHQARQNRPLRLP